VGSLRLVVVLLLVVGVVAVTVAVAQGERSAAAQSIVLLPGVSAAQFKAAPIPLNGSIELTISGLMTLKGRASSGTCEYDAFYGRCGSDKWPSVPGDSIGVADSPTGKVTFLSWHLPGSCAAGDVAKGYPAFQPTHRYVVALKSTGKPFFVASPFGGALPAGQTLSGSFTLDFGAGSPDPCRTTPFRSLQGRSAINEVRVISVVPDVQFHRQGCKEWQTLHVDTVLKQGDEISCDPDGSVVLAFEDNSKVTVAGTTQLKIGSFFTEGGIVRTEILLKMGEVAAKVNKAEGTKSDFRIKEPTGTTSMRDTAFSVFYDPGSRAGITRVTKDVAEVDPTKPGLPTVRVPAGKEIEVTATSESPISPIGKADARGGIDRLLARDRALKVVSRFNGPCQVTTPRAGAFSVKPVPAGWLVSVLMTGKLNGWSTWQVSGAKVTPLNKLAKTIAGGCKIVKPPPPPASKAKAGHYAGTTDQGKSVSFDVTADSSNETNLSAVGSVTCADASQWTWTVTSNSNNAISPALTFSYSYNGPLTISDTSITNLNASFSLAGTLTTTGTASGTFVITHITWDKNGTHYDCTGTSTNWTAKLSP
jgi:hypothetical protein